MDHIKDAQLLIALFFGLFGFILAYFLRRGLNLILFGVFLYAALKGLEHLKFMPDWPSFDRFISLLQQLGKTILTLSTNMISSAGAFAILLFLCGATLGLIASRRGA